MIKVWFLNLLILLKHQVSELKSSNCSITWVSKIKQRQHSHTLIASHLPISWSFIVQNQLLVRNSLLWQSILRQTKETQTCLHKMANLMNSLKEQANMETHFYSSALEILLNLTQIVMIHSLNILRIMPLWFNSVEKTQILCLSFLVPWSTSQLIPGTLSSKRQVSLNSSTTIS